MSNIDDVSKTLGEVSAGVKHLIAKTHLIDEKVETLQERSVEHKASTKSAHMRIDKIAPVVEEHEAIKNKGVGIIAIVGLIFGALGSALVKVLPF